MKIFFKIILIVFLFSCNKDNKIFPPENIATINGKVSNWDLGSNKKVSLVKDSSYGFSLVDSFGNFNIANLSTPSNKSLISLDSIELAKMFNLSKHNVLTLWSPSLIVYYNNDSNQSIGSIYASNRQVSGDYNTNQGDYLYVYIYVNDDVVISGSTKYGSTSFTSIINCNLNLKKGWNKYQYKISTSNNKTMTRDIITASDPSDMKWFYTGDKK